ncbi:hypothetical protein ACFLUB_00050 [Chloroflexota bacterium]
MESGAKLAAILLSAAVLTGLAGTVIFGFNKGDETVFQKENNRQAGEGIPPIDIAVPEDTETATFALG